MRSLGIAALCRPATQQRLGRDSDAHTTFNRHGWRICCSSQRVDVRSARYPAPEGRETRELAACKTLASKQQGFG